MIVTSPNQQHKTVLLNEAVDGLAMKPDGIYIDGTFGRGGHSRLILSKLSKKGRLIAIDRDPRAIEEAKKINDERFTIVHGVFSEIEEIAIKENVQKKIDGILLDLGVSSPQLDEAERGFSFMHNGPLDMRMDDSKGQSAADWINNADESEIAWVLKYYGEEKNAKRIARTIGKRVQEKEIKTTSELAELIAACNPMKKWNKHPATRSFQAIRIHINNELVEIETTLNAALKVLSPAGRMSIISFHSLEDRMVKQFIVNHAKGAEIPKGIPLTDKQIEALGFGKAELLNFGKKIPTEAEINDNPRSRSAILRVAEKIA